MLSSTATVLGVLATVTAVVLAIGRAHADGATADDHVDQVVPASAPTTAVSAVPTQSGVPAAPSTEENSGLPEHPVPADIPADCSMDVTGPLNAWLANVPDGSEIDFAVGGCYWVEGSLRLFSRNHLVIDGHGSTFRPTARVPEAVNRAQWFLEYGSDITLRNMTLSGVNPDAVFEQDTAYDHNVFIRGTHGVTVDRVHGGNTYGDFVSIAQGKDDRTIPSDIVVENSSATNVGRMAVSCVACDGWTVRDSTFDHIALTVFNLEVEGDHWPGRNITITGNTVGSHGWAFFSIGTPYPTTGNDISHIRISGNRMTAPATGCSPAVSLGWSLTRQSDLVIEDNTLVSRSDAVVVKATAGAVVTGNHLVRAGTWCGDTPVGVRSIDSAGALVSDNLLDGYLTEFVAQ